MATGTIKKINLIDLLKSKSYTETTDQTGYIVDIGIPTTARIISVICDGIDQVGLFYKRNTGQYALRIVNSSFGGIGRTTVNVTVYYID